MVRVTTGSFVSLVSFFGFALCLLASPLVSAQDLQATALTSTSTTPPFGTDVTLSVTIRNAGTAAAIASTAGVYISTNNIITTSDRRLGTIAVPALAVGASHSATVKVTVPPDYGTGTRWFGAFADYVNAVAETNEGNNTRSLEITVAAGSAPDLTPTALALSKTAFALGETITVDFTINNNGTADAPASTVSVRLSTNSFISTQDISLKEVAIPAIAKGSSYKGTTTVTVSSASATNYIGVFVDPTPSSPGKIPESTETNNTRAVEVTINAVDLLVEALQVSPANFGASSAIVITATVRNAGNIASKATNVAVWFSLNSSIGTGDRRVASIALPAVAAGGTLVAQSTITVTAAMMQGFTAAFYAIVEVDESKTNAERSETNNTRANRVNANGADLLTTALSLSSSLLAANAQVTVSFTIRNNGNRASAASVASVHYSTDARILTSDTRIGTVAIPALSAGTQQNFSVQVRVPTNATPTTRYIGVYADGLRTVAETDELNNARGIPFTVATLNLRTTAMAANPTSARLGQAVTVTFTIANTGTAEVPASTAGVFWSTNATISTQDALVQSVSIPKIAAGQSYSGSVSVTLPTNNNRVQPGNGFLGVYADRTTQVTESDESFADNGRGVAFTITQQIDYQPTAATTTNITPRQGQVITLAVTIKNNGTQSAPSQLTGVYFSTDATFSTNDTYITRVGYATLTAGSSRAANASVRIPTTAAPGVAYLIVFADYLRQRGETNETNNFLALKITVQGSPDLNPSANVLSTAKPNSGSSLVSTISVKNLGGFGSTVTSVALHLSTNQTFGTGDPFLGTATLGAIAANGQATVTINATIPATTAAGRYYLLAVVDPQSRVTESNENNNVLATVIDVVTLPTPDLFVPNLGTSATSAKAGDALTVTFTTRNSGTSAAGASSTNIYFSTNAKPSAGDVLLTKVATTALNAGASANLSGSITIPATAAAGAAYLHIVADGDKAIAEGDETNNASSVKITITSLTDPDTDGDGVPASKDCNDNDKTIYPGNTEVCDGKDNDCNMKADDGNLCAAGETCDSVAKMCVPANTEPIPDAGGGCPGGCPNGQICLNNVCVTLPDAGEKGPEEGTTDGDEGTTDGTEPTSDATPTDNGGEALADTTSPEKKGADSVSIADTAGKEGQADTGTKEGGSGADKSAGVDTTAPGGGCGCSAGNQSPAMPLLLLFVFALIALRRRQEH